MGWGDIKDSMNAEIYKGFRIVPGRVYMGGDGTPEKWSVSTQIQREGSDKPPRTFTLKGAFSCNEHEAIRQSLEYARSVINGEVPGECVVDL